MASMNYFLNVYSYVCYEAYLLEKLFVKKTHCSATQTWIKYFFSQIVTIYLRNKSWKPECVGSF